MLRGPELLEVAATLIEQRGKCEYDYVDTEGRLCALGALCAAYTGGVSAEFIEDRMGTMPEVAWIANFVRLSLGHGAWGWSDHYGVWGWSDSRSQEVVVAGLRQTAAMMREADWSLENALPPNYYAEEVSEFKSLGESVVQVITKELANIVAAKLRDEPRLWGDVAPWEEFRAKLNLPEKEEVPG